MPSVKVVVNLPGKQPYDVRIGEGVLDSLGSKLRAVLPACTQVALVSDSNVAPLYGSSAKAALKAEGFSVVEITLPAGEQSKSVDVVAEVWKALAAKRLDRDSCIVALGGGVVGDLAGFAAATYLRGIALAQVPTSLLAMVDSSVGGKTGIDLEAGKNLVGAFKQPDFVLADTAALATLPEREWASGLGEVAKSAVLAGDEFFFWLRDAADDMRAQDAQAVREAVMRCVVFKADIVAADEHERTGTRACLNYGHTLGHAIEKLAGYGAFSHGEAVAEGMRFAARLAVAQVDASLAFVEAQDELLDALGLPGLDFSAPADELLAAMRSDKKAQAGAVRFVLPHDVGSWELAEVPDEVLLEHLGAWSRSKA